LRSEPELATFTDWLDGRRPLHLSTNAGTGEVAFQTWRKLKEAFAPELIAQAFEETSTALGRPVRSCIDPFGGSGTTALACQFLGVHPTTIEVNPYLADLIEAKLARYDLEELIADFKTVIESPSLKVVKPLSGAPKTFVEPGVSGRFLFTRQVAQRLASFRELIAQVPNSANRCLMRVLLGAVALSVSNVLVSGKGRRYRRDWATRPALADRVDALFSDAVVRAIYEIRRFQNRKVKSYKLIRGDARILFPNRSSFDLAVFSPPYPNSFDYTDVYNVELWVCGYLTSAEDNRALRLATLRSHVQIARSFETPGLTSTTLTRVASELDGVRDKLWDPNIPGMVRAYFADMALVLSKIGRSLRGGGRIYIVVGDSRYGGVQVPVATILSEIALSMGYVLAGGEPFRSMRASPQQGGRHELVETLLTLSRN
jgi:DNA modification methylase